MTRLAVLMTCVASPTALAAAGAWEAWDVEGTPYAGYCSEDADETCIMLHCTGTDSADLAVVWLGAWAETMGRKEDLFLSIGGGDPVTIPGTVREAEGFGPEFFAHGGPVSPQVVAELATGTGFAVGPAGGGLFVPLSIDGMAEAFTSALGPCTAG